MAHRKLFFKSDVAPAFTRLVHSRFERLLYKLFKEAKSQGIFVADVELLFPLADATREEAFLNFHLVPGWLAQEFGEEFSANISKSIGDWARFRDPKQTDICGDRSGPEKTVCGLERDHPGDHMQHHSSGGCIGWPRLYHPDRHQRT